MNRKRNEPGFSRRKFAETVTWMAVATAAPVNAQTPPADATGLETWEVEARVAEVMRRYGSRLSEEQRERIRSIIVRNGRMLAAVRTYPLLNGDCMATTLKLQPGEETFQKDRK